MGRYITQAPRVKKQQVFTVSGIFTPSPGLLAAGGVVTVRCVGGGGGGGMRPIPGGFPYTGSTSNVHATGCGGGSGADITRIVVVSSTVDVLVGAGGSGGSTSRFNKSSKPGDIDHHTQLYIPPTDGGNTSFGSLVIAGGGKAAFSKTIMGGTNYYPGEGGGEGGHAGGFPYKAYYAKPIWGWSTNQMTEICTGNGGGAGGGIGRMEEGFGDGTLFSHNENSNGRPNTGGGGAGGGGFYVKFQADTELHAGNGGSGLCIVTWEE